MLETVPSPLHILALNGNNTEEAIVRVVNDTRDSGPIASPVLAAMGALHVRRTQSKVHALERRW